MNWQGLSTATTSSGGGASPNRDSSGLGDIGEPITSLHRQSQWVGLTSVVMVCARQLWNKTIRSSLHISSLTADAQRHNQVIHSHWSNEIVYFIGAGAAGKLQEPLCNHRTKMPVVFARDMPQKTWGYCVVECELAKREPSMESEDDGVGAGIVMISWWKSWQPVLLVRFSQLDTSNYS